MWAYMADDPERIQRRQFLRVQCLWDILVFHLGRERREPMSVKWLPAKAIDISLGGCRFKIPREAAGRMFFKMDERILVHFTFADAPLVMLVGRVTRAAAEKGFWEVGIGFDSLPAKIEKKLFEFIRQQEILWRDE
jgi:c-di-GMP-binding flagellar brake protein YcgR